MTEAAKCGFDQDRGAWANLGQGAPEAGVLPEAPPRVERLEISVDAQEYSPVVGLPELRDAVAELYNYRYRKDKKSKYTRANVAICAGGRLALTRLVSTLGHTNIGHFLPDYTAYEELLESFGRFVPIPILLDSDERYSFSAAQLRREILGRGLSVVLLSNPSNPTGAVLHGETLQSWVATARELDCALLFDEFYSHYVYGLERPYISAAEFVEDVNKDPIIIFDGLTKNWRYPGFRVSWTVGPPEVIEALASAGSFLDGGCARPMQEAAVELVNPEIADGEAHAIQKTFTEKRTLMLEGLKSVGISVTAPPVGTFYCWGDLSGLPGNLNSGMNLFRAGLQEKTIIVPGLFFDINPGHRRPDRASRFGNYARFSFGPPKAELERGIAGLARAIKRG